MTRKFANGENMKKKIKIFAGHFCVTQSQFGRKLPEFQIAHFAVLKFTVLACV